MRRRRLVRALSTSTIVLSALLAGCAPLFAADPRYATDSGARPQGQPTTGKKADGPPAIEAPKNDLSWRNCTSQVFSDSAVQPLPGVTLDCATYDADLDSINGATGSMSIGVVRARSAQTPEDAGPLVMTTGSDLPTSVQLPVWLSRAGADVLKSHPIVAVDRRGMGTSSSIDCRDLFDRQEMLDQAQFQSGDDPVANLGAITMTATTSCTDTIAPGDSAYDNAHAAEDIERLRSTWDVPSIALLGIGNGAQVALAYAGSHPGKVARLVLDSPLPLGIAAEGATEQRVKGEQTALDAFASQCAATNCPLAPDPKAAVDALLAAARAGNGPERSVGLHGRRRDQHRACLSARRPHGRDQQPGLRGGFGALGRPQPDEQPDHPGRHAPPKRRSVRQLVQRRPEPAHPRPRPRTHRRLAQALSTVRRGRRAQHGQVPELAERVGTARAEEPQDPSASARRAERPDRRQRRRRPGRGDHHQRGHLQQAGDLAGHRARREHLLRVRVRAGHRLPRQRQPACHRHILPRLVLPRRPPVYGSLVAAPDSIRTGLLNLFRPRTSPPSAATVLRSTLWPLAILLIVHRSYVLATNGYITDDFGPVYRAVVNFRRGWDIYNEHFDYVDPHYLYPPGGTLLMAPVRLPARRRVAVLVHRDQRDRDHRRRLSPGEAVQLHRLLGRLPSPACCDVLHRSR